MLFVLLLTTSVFTTTCLVTLLNWKHQLEPAARVSELVKAGGAMIGNTLMRLRCIVSALVVIQKVKILVFLLTRHCAIAIGCTPPRTCLCLKNHFSASNHRTDMKLFVYDLNTSKKE